MQFEKLVEVWHGPIVECEHFGAAVVADADGKIIAGWGDPDYVTYPRSSLKPFQAIALVESGAAEAFGLTARHIALASASHRGEPMHTDLATEWLARLDLDHTALACGAAYPRDQELINRLVKSDIPPNPIYHNCSGKHAGFLTLCRHKGWDVAGYNDPAHPAQQYYFDVLSDFLGKESRDLPLGVDGCTLPAVALSLREMATAMARMAARKVSSVARREAAATIQDAINRHPDYVSGSDQANVVVCRATKGRVLIKSGAAGYIAAQLPQDGIGVALKIADGNSRARYMAFLTLLTELNLLDDEETGALADLYETPLLNSRNDVVGKICVASDTVSRLKLGVADATE